MDIVERKVDDVLDAVAQMACAGLTIPLGGRRAGGRRHGWRGDSDQAERADERPAPGEGRGPGHWPPQPTRLLVVHPILLFRPAFRPLCRASQPVTLRDWTELQATARQRQSQPLLSSSRPLAWPPAIQIAMPHLP